MVVNSEIEFSNDTVLPLRISGAVKKENPFEPGHSFLIINGLGFEVMNQLENVLPWELHSPNALLSASILKYKPNGEGLFLGEIVLNIAFIVKHDGVTALQPYLIILRDARLL